MRDPSFDYEYDDDEYPAPPPPARSLRLPAIAMGAMLAVAVGLSGLTLVRQGSLEDRERAEWHAELESLRARVRAVEGNVNALDGRSRQTARTVARTKAGIAPLATRVLRSVFTIETETGFGSGFMGWQEDGASYVVTAHHVIADAPRPFVRVSRKGGTWSGEIVARDKPHDLAVIRVSARPAGAKPLWPAPRIAKPRAGERLLLIGSPFGLEGTVTTGVVSRVTKRYIQTDAAANPGNSGGPAIDEDGNVVGVLVSGGGQNVNFVIPIRHACSKVRDC